MKKAFAALLVVVLLVAGGAAVWWFFLRARPVYKAEDLLPAQTIALLDVPNSDDARKNWVQTPLAQIWHEKEVQDFLARPTQALKGQVAKDQKARDAQTY